MGNICQSMRQVPQRNLFIGKNYCIYLENCVYCTSRAEIAQLVEHFTRNEGVVGSSPIFSLDREVLKTYVFKTFCAFWGYTVT